MLTDIIMPGADGLEVLEAAKIINPALNVVIITGYASLDTAVKAVRLGAFDYLSKPFTLAEIEMLVHRLGEQLQLQRASGTSGGPQVLDHSETRVLGRLDEISLRLERLEQLVASLTTRSVPAP